MAYTKEQRHEYYLKQKAKKGKTTNRSYNRKKKIGEWNIVYQSSNNIAILSKYLKFRFYKEGVNVSTYDEVKYEPIRRKIRNSIGCQNITVIEKGFVQLYIKGFENVENAIENADRIIAEYESIYGTEYQNVRSREYKSKKKSSENLE